MFYTLSLLMVTKTGSLTHGKQRLDWCMKRSLTITRILQGHCESTAPALFRSKILPYIPVKKQRFCYMYDAFTFCNDQNTIYVVL